MLRRAVKLLSATLPRIHCFLILAGCSGVLHAQVDGTTGGIAPFGSYTNDVLGRINAANLNIHLVIPIRTKEKFFAALEKENNQWTQLNFSWWFSGSSFDLFTSLTSNIGVNSAGCSDGSGGTRVNFQSVDSTGFSHNYPLILSPQGCDNLPTSGVATDAYGYTLNADLGSAVWTVTDPGGSVYSGDIFSSAAVVDPNGNQFTYSSSPTAHYTDPTGNMFLGVAAGNPTQYSWSDANGTTQTISVTTTPYSKQTNFGCPGVIESNDSTPVNLPTTIALPDGSQYQLTYEQTPGYGPSYTTGRVKSMTLPTGGQVVYVYNGPHNGISCEDGGTSGFTRTTPDGTWTYSRSWDSSKLQWTTVIAAPNGQTATYTFTGRFNELLEVRRVYAEPNGTVVATIDTCYNGNTSLASCSTTSWVNPDPPNMITVFTELPNASGKVSRRDTYYDNTSRITRVDSFDFGTGAPGPVLQRVSTIYGTWNGSSCVPIGSNISEPCNILIDDGITTLSNNLFSYDSHGNKTGHNFWTGSRWLGRSATYNSNGTLATTTDVNSALGTYSGYQCNGQFPGSYKVSGLTWNYIWDCNGGVLTSVSDSNNQPVNYAYNDPFWRLTSITDPLGNATSISYTPDSVDRAMVFNSNNSTTETVATVDGIGRKSLLQKRLSPGSALFDTVQYKYDTNGRLGSVSQPCQVGLGVGCTTPVTTFSYDAAWRLLSKSDGSGTVAEAYSGNDMLTTVGPAPNGENTKRRQMEYDGLYRLTSVCELTNVSGSGSCGQFSPQTGFWTKYAHDGLGNLTGVTQNAQAAALQTRSFSYDGLGRLASENNPENGTTTYIYDSASNPCGWGPFGNPGDLIQKLDAKGDSICYQHDGLHRLLAVGNSNQSQTNYVKIFRYDSPGNGFLSPPPGATFANTAGRLVEAETDYAGRITDEWFSYSARGETTDMYDSTPNSNGYYHLSKSYWANGEVNTMSGLPGVPTIIYGVDGEGRWNTVSDGSPQNLITNTSYNAASQVTGVTFGTGDSDSYQYDPNTGTMNQYTFLVNGQSVIGNMNWNGNGTLRQLQISQDDFNPANVQTCAYGYDDLARIASVNCGSVWGQTFSYDSFGNITKSGSISWVPGYNSATNQYLTASNCQSSGGTPCYDNDGNLLSDGFHTYQWNVHGEPILIDGSVQVTFDALGNLVETNEPGWVAQTLRDFDGTMLGYSQAGAAGLEWIPLPGGGVASYDQGVLQNYNHADWLGSVRLSTTPSQALTQDWALAPFGEQYAKDTAGPNPINWFTGIGQSLEFDLYDALNREYHPTQGRWISPDPAGLSAADPTNPQSWNRYAYVLNNPLSNVDPSGLECVWDDGSFDAFDDPQTGSAQWCADQGGTWVEPDLFESAMLTNGQWNSNPGDWSSSPNSYLAENWVGASATAYGGGMAYIREAQDAVDAYLGDGPKEIEYTSEDPFVLSFQQSTAMLAITSWIKEKGCKSKGVGGVGTFDAFVNSVMDIWANKDNWYNPEAQIGAFDFNYARSGGVLDVTVYNDISLNSQFLHIPASLGIKNPTSGPNGTVHQTLHITTPDPCGGS